MKVLRVQDHHGQCPQVHSSGKEEPIPKTILGDEQEKRWHLDWARSNRKEHRAAEEASRSGPTELRDHVAARGMEVLGSMVKMGEIQIYGETSKGVDRQKKNIGGLGKRSSRPKDKINSCRWKRSAQEKGHQLLDPKNTVGRNSQNLRR